MNVKFHGIYLGENMYKDLYSVCWNITGKCNENCLFCYRTIENELSFDDNKRIANVLINENIKKITIAGGEPLLYEYLFDIAKYIKNRNSNIFLSITTNGLLVEGDSIEKILKYFDSITLSIDGDNENIHQELGRGKVHFKKNIWLLAQLDGKIRIKVNSVITSNNLYSIIGLKSIFEKYKIKRWKIMRFYPVSFMAKENKQFYTISDEQFDSLKNVLVSDSKMVIQFNDYNEFENSYLNIFPNGNMSDNRGAIVGNILNDGFNQCIQKCNISQHYIRKAANKGFSY